MDYGVELIHHDEENAALNVEEQHYAHSVCGGKGIIDEDLILIAKYETADIFYDHEVTDPPLVIEGRVNGVVLRELDGQQPTITADTVVLACGGFEGNPEMLTQYTGKDVGDLPIIVPGIKYNRGGGIRTAMYIGAAQPDSSTRSTPSSSIRERGGPTRSSGVRTRGS